MLSCNFISLKTMTTLPETTKSLPLDPRYLIPIDFSSTLGLPESHAWSEPGDAGDDNLSFNNDDVSLPIIDLMDPNAPEQIALACEKWGAFRIKNHGIPFEVFERVEEGTKRLFSLPHEQKMTAIRSPSGFSGYGTAKVAPYYPKLTWHEGFTFFDSPSDDAKKIWPNDYASFCESMENFVKQMKIVSERLTEMILKFLGISEEKRKWIGGSNIPGAVQLNFYPSCPEPKRAMGLGAHTDTSLFTLLHLPQTTNSNTGCLQVFLEGKGWVEVHSQPNTLVVHTGDFLHIISNGRFRSALHRVTVDSSKERYSMGFFYSPPKDYVVSPLLGGDLHHSPPRFRDVTVKDYTEIKYKNLGQGLPLIAIN